jgi:TP901 family phage tail tape measure protein
MTEKLNIELDGSELLQSLKQITSSIEELRGAFAALAKSPTERLRQNVNEVSGAFNTMAREAKTNLEQVVKSVETSMAKAKDKAKVGVKALAAAGQAEADKNPISIRVKVPSIKNKDGTTSSLSGSEMSRPELLSEQARLQSAPGAINAASQQLMYQRLRSQTKLLWADKKADASAAIAEQAAQEGTLHRSLKTQSKLLWADKKADATATLAEQAAQEGTLHRSLKTQTKLLWADKKADAARDISERSSAEYLLYQRLKSQSKLLWAQKKADASAAMYAMSRSATVVVNRASKSPLGDYSVSEGVNRGILRTVSAEASAAGPAIATVATESKKAAKAGDALVGTNARLAGGMRDLHSAARGLASGFGAMWLTWGNITPLLAGAAISGAVVQTVKVGAQVQDTMTRLRVLGNESSDSVAGLNTQMQELARTGPFGPLEIAEAMKTLTLAGLSAVEVSSSIKDVLNFSIAGDVGIQQAAEAVTTIATAFGVSASGFGYVTDAISKAAAETKSSVEDLAAAFKTASVIHQKYGVSLEETAVGLSLMANAGIKGTAAGTALRNMYADLGGRTKAVTDELKDLGVAPFDKATGKMRETGKVFKELLVALSDKRSVDDARKSLDKIFSERGSKEAFALFEALKTKAKEAGTDVSNVYDELIKKVSEAAGFTAIAAAEIGLTPLNQMRSVASTLQSVMVETFESVQPYVLSVAASLKEIINSDGFKRSLQDLVVLIGSVVKLTLEHGKAIVQVLIAYQGFKAVATVIAGVAGAMAAMAATTTTATGAVVALGAATRAAAAANPVLLALTAVVTLGAVAWATYQMWADKGADATKKNMDLDRSQFIKTLEDERDRLKEINTAARENISLEALRTRTKVVSTSSERVGEAQAKVNELQAMFDKASPDGSTPGMPSKRQELIGRSLKEAQSRLALANNVRAGEIRTAYTVQAQIRAEAKEIADRERARSLELLQQVIGNPNLKPQEDQGEGKAGAGRFSHNNELEQVSKRYSDAMSVIKNEEANQQKLLDASHSATLINDGTFFAEQLKLTAKSEAAQLDLLKANRAAYEAAYSDRQGKLSSDLSDARKDNIGKKDPAKGNAAALKRYNEGLEKLKATRDTYIASLDSDASKISSGAETRAQLQQIALRGEFEKTGRASDDFWRSEEEARIRAAEQTSTEDAMRYASPEQQARIAAMSTETGRLAAVMLDYDHTIAKLRENLFGFLAVSGPVSKMNDDERAAFEQLNLNIEQNIRLRDKLVGKVKEKGDAAVVKFEKDERAKLVSSLSDAVEVGLYQGGAAGSKSIRQVLKDELRKPIKLAITALVNTVFDGLLGQGGGAAGSASVGGDALGGISKFLSSAGQATGDGIGMAITSLMGWLPSFAVGTDYVPHDMVANIHKGERIVPASQNKPGSVSSGPPIIVHQNFTVGDVASLSQVRQEVKGAEQRIAISIGRSQRYEGAMS